MNYSKYKDGNYIFAVFADNSGNVQITETEYNQIMSVIQSRPTPPTGYDYRLKTDLTWELYELPPVPPDDEDATEDDYQNQLERLGVDV